MDPRLSILLSTISTLLVLVTRSIIIAIAALIYNITLIFHVMPLSLTHNTIMQLTLEKDAYSIIIILAETTLIAVMIVTKVMSSLRSKHYIDTFIRNVAYVSVKDILIYVLCCRRSCIALSLIAASAAIYSLSSTPPLLYTYTNMLYPLLLYTSIALVPFAIILASIEISATITAILVTVAAVVAPQPLLLMAFIAMLPIETTPVTIKLKKRNGFSIGYLEAVLVDSPSLKYNIEGQKSFSATRSWWSPAYPTSSRYSVKITVKENPNIIVTGTTGSGKSFTAMRLARAILEKSDNKAVLIVIDPHGEYKSLLNNHTVNIRVVDASQEAPNPLELTGRSPRERAAELVELVSEFYNLGPIQARILEDAILLSYENAGIRDNDPSTWERSPPTIRDVIAILEDMSRRDTRARIVAMYLSSLAAKAFSQDRLPFPAPDSGLSAVVFDLSRLATREQMVLYTETILYKLYNLVKALGPADSLRYILLVDEAHIFARKTSRKRAVLPLIAAELRKYGVALILVTQRASELDETILANMGTYICLKHTDTKESKFIAEVVSKNPLNSDAKEILVYTLSTIPKGYAVVGDIEIETPLLVKLQERYQNSVIYGL